MRGLKVKCLSCSGVFHETTEFFYPLKALNGTMFKLLPEYGFAGHNWSSFPQDESIMDADLECPGCGSCYLNNIRLILASGNSVSFNEFKTALQEETDRNNRPRKKSSKYDGMSWNELRALASKRGLYKNGMNKNDVLKALIDEEEE